MIFAISLLEMQAISGYSCLMALTHDPAAASPRPPMASSQITPELRSETMAFALQNGFFNLGANLFEPAVGRWVQQRYAKPTHARHGTYLQNLGGEVAGDISGTAALILSEALFPQQLHGVLRAGRALCDPLYEALAPYALKDDPASSGYAQAKEEWKTFQGRSLVRTLIMDTANIASNITVQKTLIKNPSPAGVILKGKLLSTALSASLLLGARFVAPNRTGKADEWIGEIIFEPMLSEEPIPIVNKHMINNNKNSIRLTLE